MVDYFNPLLVRLIETSLDCIIIVITRYVSLAMHSATAYTTVGYHCCAVQDEDVIGGEGAPASDSSPSAI
jgi:hypothetical protein